MVRCCKLMIVALCFSWVSNVSAALPPTSATIESCTTIKKIPAEEPADSPSTGMPLLRSTVRFLPLNPNRQYRTNPHAEQVTVPVKMSMPNASLVMPELAAKPMRAMDNYSADSAVNTSGMSEEQAQQILSIYGASH